MVWLPLLVFVAHMLEEIPRFPAWATRRFGATSNAWYAYSHVVLVAAAIAICLWADGAPAESVARVASTALMLTMAWNGVFHVVATILFREYSPGVVTSVALFFPATAYVLRETVTQALLTPAQIGIAIGVGALVQVAVIASLYLPMDVDWRLRGPACRARA